MNWLTEGTTWDVVQEWRRRFPNHSDSRISTQDMRAVLAETKVIAKVQGKKHRFVIVTMEELKNHNMEVRLINQAIRAKRRIPC